MWGRRGQILRIWIRAVIYCSVCGPCRLRRNLCCPSRRNCAKFTGETCWCLSFNSTTNLDTIELLEVIFWRWHYRATTWELLSCLFALVNKPFPIGYERWERFRRRVDRYHTSWTTDKWKSTKPHVTCRSLGIKGSHFAWYSYWGWKKDLFWESQAQKIMGRPRSTIHIDLKTESLWQKDDALCLVGPEWHTLLWTVKTWRNG